MPRQSPQLDPRHAQDCLNRWVECRLDEPGLNWFRERKQAIATERSARDLFVAFSTAPRHSGRLPLMLSAEEQAGAVSVCHGWKPRWSVDQCVRTALILAYPPDPEEQFFASIARLFMAAELHELIALYQSLPLLPHGKRFVALAEEGIRSNMTPVFEAVALHNPYPARHFSDSQWNQLVLKALFVGSPLNAIEQLDERRNPALARMAIDYSRERRSAGRTVPVQLWRLVSPFMTPGYVADAQRALQQAEPSEQQAASLALFGSGLPEAQELFCQSPWRHAVENGEIEWHRLP